MSPFNVYDTDKKEYRHRSLIRQDETPATREELAQTEDPNVVVVMTEQTGNILKGVKGTRTWVECYRVYQEPDEEGNLMDVLVTLPFSYESN